MQENTQETWQCKVSPTLGGGFDGTQESAWGTTEYLYMDRPTVFMGIYSYLDFLGVWTHVNRGGIAAILWCGGDIVRLTKTGYWLHESPDIILDSHKLALWLNKNCENYCENEWEYIELKKMGVEAKVVPSFLGNADEYEVSFKPGNKVYASVSSNNFEQYGWHKINAMAKYNRDIEFHLYGNTTPWKAETENVVVHGRVPIEQMNAEIKDMQAGIRLLSEDGFSEILAKSILWGQYPISEIEYPYMLKPHHLRMVLDKKVPNFQGRNYYLEKINQYPWNRNAKNNFSAKN